MLEGTSIRDILIRYITAKDDNKGSIAQEIRQALQKAKIEIYSVWLKDDNIAGLAAGLEQNTALLELMLNSNNISDNGTARLASSLEKNQKLKILKLVDNSIGNNGLKAVARMLTINSSLKKLFFHSDKVTDEGAIELAGALSHNHSLTSLEVDCKNAGFPAIQAFALMLKSNSSLSNLSLGIIAGENGAKEFTKVLQERHLKELRLESIGDAGALAFAEFLTKYNTLSSLVIVFNGIGIVGCKALAKALPNNYSLTKLSLSGNNLSSLGMHYLEIALEYNHSIKEMTFDSEWAYPQIGSTLVNKQRLDLSKLFYTLGQVLASKEAPIEIIWAILPFLKSTKSATNQKILDSSNRTLFSLASKGHRHLVRTPLAEGLPCKEVMQKLHLNTSDSQGSEDTSVKSKTGIKRKKL